MTNQEIIEVVQAAERGEEIQSQWTYGGVDWVDDPGPSWNFAERNYRVKPKPLVLWCNVYGNGVLVATRHRSKPRHQPARTPSASPFAWWSRRNSLLDPVVEKAL